MFQDTELVDGSLLDTLKQFYDSGGLALFFGIYGVFTDPSDLSALFELPEAWRFSAYTRHAYETTYTATDYMDGGTSELGYTKSNLVHVPMQDR